MEETRPTEEGCWELILVTLNMEDGLHWAEILHKRQLALASQLKEAASVNLMIKCLSEELLWTSAGFLWWRGNAMRVVPQVLEVQIHLLLQEGTVLAV